MGQLTALGAHGSSFRVDAVSTLGIEVSPELLGKWIGWLAPDPQPFVVGSDDRWSGIDDQDRVLTPELRDTFRLYGGPRGVGDTDSRILWISEDRFHSLSKSTRAALVREQVVRKRGVVPTVRGWSDLLDPAELRRQADGHRFVWWRSLVATDPAAILSRVVATGRLASRHAEVAEATWRRAADVLPNARQLAGTFASGSNTCCFGTVMAAADADDSRACESLEPFDDWLSEACRKGGDAAQLGTVLVWRSHMGDTVHAAVSLGDGWGLEKPSRDWHSPRAVAQIPEIIRMSRHAGERLERHTILR